MSSDTNVSLDHIQPILNFVQTILNVVIADCLNMSLSSGLLFGLIVCELMGITGISRNVVLLQCAMPIAVFNYLLALRYDRRPDEIAAMVLVSTLMAFIGLPFLLAAML